MTYVVHADITLEVPTEGHVKEYLGYLLEGSWVSKVEATFSHRVEMEPTPPMNPHPSSGAGKLDGFPGRAL